MPGASHLPVGRLLGQSRAGPVKDPIHTPLAAALAPRGGDALRPGVYVAYDKRRCKRRL